MPDSTRTDAELAAQARQGNTDAFGHLVRRHHGAVYAIAFGWTRNPQDAEDLAQDAFYLAFVRLDALRDLSTFPAWLNTLTRNLCRMWHRSARPFASLDESRPDGLSWEVPDPGRSPVEMMETRERDRAVHSALGQLPDSMRETANLFYLHGMSHRQIGLFLDVPISTVKIRLHKARQRIRQQGVADMSETTVPITAAEGVLHIHEDGYGFLRPDAGAAGDPADIYVAASQIFRFELEEGDRVTGHARPPRDDERYVALLKIATVNDEPREAKTRRAGGVLHVDEQGYGFLRPTAQSESDVEDTYLSARQIGRLSLSKGDRVTGFSRPPRNDENFWALVKIDRINDQWTQTA